MIQLSKLTVQNFGGIQAAEVAFRPGLNVLFGPNELGKSTLAEALRAVLLLSPTSSAHEPFVPWASAAVPEVELIFSTEPGRFWRLKKSFASGTRGNAVLDESKDGVAFNNVCKARRVDEEVRKLLEWGIPAPGGRGGRTGWPESFLSAALLGRQDEVNNVFTRKLAEDAEESGKHLLGRALQAMATDWLVAKVLAAANERVDVAFTSKGGRKTAEGSPFRAISDEIKRAEEDVRKAQEQRQQSDDVVQRLQELRGQHLEQSEAVAVAKGTLTERRQLWQKRRDIEQRLKDAKAARDQARQVHDLVTEKERDERTTRTTLDGLTLKVTDAANATVEAEQAFQIARQELERITSQENVAQQKIAQQALEKRLLELTAAESDANRLAEQARSVQSLEGQAARLADEETQLNVQLTGARTDVAQQSAAEQAARTELEQLGHVEVWLRRELARKLRQQAEGKVQQLEQLRRDETAKRAEADALSQPAQKTLPSAEQLAALRQLERELRVAEARLEVGLSAEITPLKKLALTATADRRKPAEHSLKDEPLTLEAARVLKLNIDGIADIVVTGGSSDARKAATDLSRRWKRESQPLLDQAGAANLEELEATCQAAAQHAQQLRDLIREADTLRDRIVSLGDPATELTTQSQACTDFDTALSQCDDALLAKLAATLGDGKKLASRRTQLEKNLATATSQLDAARGQVIRGESRLESLQKELSVARNASTQAAAKLSPDTGKLFASQSWSLVLKNAEAARTAAATQKQAVERELKELTKAEQTGLPQAEAKQKQAEETWQSAQKLEAEAKQKQTTSAAELSSLQGELKARRERAESVNLQELEASVTRIDHELSQLPAARQPLNEQTLDAEVCELKKAESALGELERQIAKEEGALGLVGGDVARERYASFKEALDRKQAYEMELERDYDAWKLLLETVRAAESEDASNLGQAVSPTLTARFGELTRHRYGRLVLGPNLETTGIEANGLPRAVELLSMGTREQLSALFRLALAEQLQCVLLFDDQLAQSDLDRMNWFNRLLRETACQTQIIVLTCRPTDYLTATELPRDGLAMHDSTHGLLHAVNLELVMQSANRPGSTDRGQALRNSELAK